MLTAYRGTARAIMNQARVVHQLPGRLRLHIPVLERLSPDWLRYQSDLIEIIKRRPGFRAIDFSIVSGRVLVCYDPDQITPDQVLQWFRRVALMCCEGYAEAPFQSQHKIAPFLKRMRAQSRLWL